MINKNPHAECPYFIGDIYQTKSLVHPEARWPGTKWKSITTFLYGNTHQQAIGATGGAATVILTESQLPHITIPVMYAEKYGLALNGGTKAGYSIPFNPPPSTLYGCPDIGVTFGGNQPHENLPPYTTVYIWERIA